MVMKKHSLGKTLLEARQKKGYGLREFAGMLEMSPSHLSDIENDRRKPGPGKLEKMATFLELGMEDLNDLDTRIDKQIRDIVENEPEAGFLLRKIRQDPALLKKMIDLAKKEK
jgi:transcriptional regulator with XRE-family HTH domain